MYFKSIEFFKREPCFEAGDNWKFETSWLGKESFPVEETLKVGNLPPQWSFLQDSFCNIPHWESANIKITDRGMWLRRNSPKIIIPYPRVTPSYFHFFLGGGGGGKKFLNSE